MSKRRWHLAHRHARFLQGNYPYRDLAEDLYSGQRVTFTDDTTLEPLHYKDWLLRSADLNGRGPAMRRALIRAYHRYEMLKPARVRASRVRRGYPTKWR